MYKKILDLFTGLGGASAAFDDDPDWKVTTLDVEERFKPDYCMDILDVQPGHELLKEHFDVVWASPPCPAFSVAAIGKNWTIDHLPKRVEAVDAVRLVFHTLWVIQELKPDYWFMENPRGKLRRILHIPTSGTMHYCQYGHNWQKPTDIWGNVPASFEFKTCSPGDPCHEAAELGTKQGGVQGVRDPAVRSKVPYGVSKAVLKAVNNPGGNKQTQLMRKKELAGDDSK